MDKKYILGKNKLDQELLLEYDKCDKYDYLVAVGCGAIGGMIDSFLVGSPTDSKLLSWTDSQINKVVISFSKLNGWKPNAGNENDVSKAILFLQNKYKVNYDQSIRTSAAEVYGIKPSNHHMKSLGHSPDIIGLFFSIIDQFRSTSSFLSDGKMITITSDTFELRGGNYIAKIYCGVVNWFGHLMSDVAGSSASKGRGAGIVIPFYELFGLFGPRGFNGDQDKKTIADIATRAFEQGYDLRYGIAQAIPVVITDLLIRLSWELRRIVMKKNNRDCIPSNSHYELRVMLLVGNGTLCLIDGLDSGIRSGGNSMAFFCRLNYVAWFKLAMMVLKEVRIRVGINEDLEKYLESFKRVEAEISRYLNELEKIDIEAYKRETEKYIKMGDVIRKAKSDEQLNLILLNSMKEMGVSIPWTGEFDDFMRNKENKLVFKK